MLIRARIALVAVAVLARSAAAQDHQYAPLIVRLPSSARYLAMGNAAMGSRDDDVLFYNPAQIVVARGMSASAEQFSSTIHGGALSSVTRFNSGGIALGAEMLSGRVHANSYPLGIGDLSTPNRRGTSLTSLVVSAGFAQVYKSLRVGVAAKYVEDDVDGFQLGRGLVDIGLSKDLFRGYTFGLALQNLGKRNTLFGESIDLPTRLTFGAANGRQAGPFDLLMTAEVSAMRGGWIAPAGGAELAYSWLDGYTVALRAGARRPMQGQEPMTAGAGLTIDRVSFDYALETAAHSRFGHRIGLRVR